MIKELLFINLILFSDISISKDFFRFEFSERFVKSKEIRLQSIDHLPLNFTHQRHESWY
jgi:hypothetical protein